MDSKDKMVKILCPAARVLIILILITGLCSISVLYVLDIKNIVTVIIEILTVVLPIVLAIVRGTIEAGDEGIEVKMPIGRNRVIPYADISAVTLDAAAGRKVAKSFSTRMLLQMITIATARGTVTYKTYTGETITNWGVLYDPATKAQYVAGSPFTEIAAYIRQRSGI